MSSKFYDTVNRLDQLMVLESLTAAQVYETIQYLEEEKFSRYFFRELDNPAWMLPLYTNGFFYKVPSPLEDPNNQGYFSMPTWYAGEYLKRMAEGFPEIVTNVAISLNTDNSRAFRTMLEALLKIPAEFVAETVGQYEGWIETPFARAMMLAHELGIIMEHLAKGGQIQAALQVLSILLDPVKSPDRYKEGKIAAGSRQDFYWLNQAMQINLPNLIEIDALGVAGVAENRLIKAIELEVDPEVDGEQKKLNSYWRLSINPRSDENYESEIKNLIVDAVIHALEKGCEQRREHTSEFIGRFIDSTYSIFRRIACFILRRWGDQYPELLGKVYLAYKSEPIMAGEYEFKRLLEIQFMRLPEFARKEILNERKGPDPDRVKLLVSERPEKFVGKSVEEKSQTVFERLQLQELTPLAQFLQGEDKEYYEGLLTKHGQALPELEDGIEITSWQGPESPIERDALGKMTVDEVVHYLLNYNPPSSESFAVPSKEGLARTLEADVEARAGDYVLNANLFINEDLPFVYHVHYFRGLENATKNKQRFHLADVIGLFEFVAVREADKFQKQDFEEGLGAAKLAIGQLLEELFRGQEPFIEDDLLDRCGRLIVELLHQEEPFPDDEQAQGYDPATHSLNCLHGVAMHSLVSYGLYCERKRNKDEKGKGSPIMIPLLKSALIEILNTDQLPSLAVHSILGWYFPQFIYLDILWASENRSKIFPFETELAKYWQAAWNAYIRFSDVYTNVFPELVKEYQRALEELPILHKKEGPDRSDEKTSTHILKAYLLDMIRLDSKDGLLPLYYHTADDETRAHGNFWLSQVLDAQKPSAVDAVWGKIWTLWQWRMEEAAFSADLSAYTKEISSFNRLLKNVPLDLLELFPIIQQMLKFKTNGFDSDELIKYLGKNGEKYPSLAVSILHGIVTSRYDLYLLDDAKEAVRKILSSALEADEHAKSTAIEIVNLFGERGDYSWRPFLDKAVT